MSAVALRQALGRVSRVLGAAGVHTSAAARASDVLQEDVPSGDPIMRPFYEKIARLQVVPGLSPTESSPSETEGELEVFRMHNSSLTPIYDGHMIKATVLEVGRRAVTLDTGLKPARVAKADIPPDCVIGSVLPNADAIQRRPGQLMVGDVVQVFLEAVGTPEGDFLVSGQQAAVQRRMAAVWNELEDRQQRGELVSGRILNSVWSGYAVGVAGVVAFLPARQCSRPAARRIGQLQKFRILEVDRARPALVLADPNLVFPGTQQQGVPLRQTSNFARRLPRTDEEAARRRELTKVADELRSLLALRSGPAGGGKPPISNAGKGVGGSGGRAVSSSGSGGKHVPPATKAANRGNKKS